MHFGLVHQFTPSIYSERKETGRRGDGDTANDYADSYSYMNPLPDTTRRIELDIQRLTYFTHDCSMDEGTENMWTRSLYMGMIAVSIAMTINGIVDVPLLAYSIREEMWKYTKSIRGTSSRLASPSTMH